MGENEDSMSEDSRIGSVSLPIGLFTGYGISLSQKCWVTLFDHPEDDEYDGDLQDDDEEAPRVHFSFNLEVESASPKIVKKTEA